MPILSPDERVLAQAISDLVYSNPFLPQRIDAERRALGEEFSEDTAMWNVHPDREAPGGNVDKVKERSERLGAAMRERLAQGRRATAEELKLYEDVALFTLYYRFNVLFQETIHKAAGERAGSRRVGHFNRFREEAGFFFSVPGVTLPARDELAHIFATFYNIRRAFHHIFTSIIGVSQPAIRLRAAVWQSIFTNDLARYRRLLFNHMADFTTLVTGPSGTGKELVARAIGLSRYIPFDVQSQTFTADFALSFHPISLSALSPTLIESELFGHKRGSFTGATADHAGWLEVCKPLGTVFLDEIGEVDATIQVKLLRVLHDRVFQRIGDSQLRRFQGKIIAATNRDLAAEMGAGRFRKDFYYRLCSDIIVTPSLHEQLRDSPADLQRLIIFLARRVMGDEAEAFADQVHEYIEKHLGSDYPWPGNVRELEQCVRNLLIRGEYQPAQTAATELLDARAELARAITGGTLTAGELLSRYCTLVYSQTSSYEETARRLQLDRRTVKAKVDPQLLSRFREELG